MERRAVTMRGTRGPLLVGGAALALALAGCGSGGDYTNKLRPPAPVIVSAFVSDKAVSISPSHLGAGPITLIVTNQSQRARTVTLVTPPSDDSDNRQTGEIGPTNNATVQADVVRGDYRVKASGGGIRPAVLTIRGKRPSSQGDLQQP
jgi:hypothetical protein